MFSLLKRKFSSVIAVLLAVAMVFVLSGCMPIFDALRNAADNETAVDPLADTSWINTGDGSYMVFSGEDTYYWYQEKTVQDDNYYAGTYTCRKGQDAIDYLVNDATVLGYTEAELERTLSAYPEADRDNFISIGVYETSFMKDGKEQNDEPEWKYYLGFVLDGDDGQEMELLNLQTINYMSFEQD